MLPSNIHVTKGSKADSHLVLIGSDLMFDATCTWTITFIGRSWEADILYTHPCMDQMEQFNNKESNGLMKNRL
jgi:hypothetical protein